jgi:hypothetical protein
MEAAAEVTRVKPRLRTLGMSLRPLFRRTRSHYRFPRTIPARRHAVANGDKGLDGHMMGKRLSRFRPAKEAPPEPRSNEEADGRRHSLRHSGRDQTVRSEEASEPGTARGRSTRSESRCTASNPRAASVPENPDPQYSDPDRASPKDGLLPISGRTAGPLTGELVVTLTYAPDLDSQVSAIMVVLGELPSTRRRDPP